MGPGTAASPEADPVVGPPPGQQLVPPELLPPPLDREVPAGLRTPLGTVVNRPGARGPSPFPGRVPVPTAGPAGPGNAEGPDR